MRLWKGAATADHFNYPIEELEIVKKPDSIEIYFKTSGGWDRKTSYMVELSHGDIWRIMQICTSTISAAWPADLKVT